MNKLVEYYNHSLYQINDLYSGRVDQDNLTITDKKDSTAVRVVQLAIPLISLKPELAAPLSVAQGSLRSVVAFVQLKEAVYAGDKLKITQKLFETAVSVICIANVLFNHKTGLFVTNSYELIHGLLHAAQHIHVGEYEKGLSELSQVVGTALYLSYMLTGTLEVLLALHLLKALLSLYQSKKEYKEGRYPEVCVHLILAIANFQKAQQLHGTIEKIKQTESVLRLFERAKEGKNIYDLYEHEFHDLDEKLSERKVILEDGKGKKYDFGAHFHGYGKEAVIGMNVEVNSVTLDNRNYYEFDIAINHPLRHEIEAMIKDLQLMSQDEIQSILHFRSQIHHFHFNIF